MTADKSSHLLPKLRFPEFRDAPGWVRTPLGDAFKIITNGQANAQDHQDDGAYPLFDRSELVKRSPTFLFDAEAVILPGEGMRFQPRYFNGKFNLHQRAYALMEPTLDSCFAFHALDRFKGALADSAVKSTVLSLRMPIIEKFAIPCPTSDDEQQKIADCFGSLDDLIATEDRKLKALLQHKRGLMQQLLPQPGETVPKLRFPEFRDAPDWKEKALEDACYILNNRRVPITSSDRKSGPYPYYGASGVVDYVDDYLFDERLVLVGEDGAKWGAFQPTAFVADGKYWVNNHAHVLRPHATNDTLLANYLTMIDLGEFVTGAAPPKLTLGKLKTIRIPLSPIEDEHQAIADCLSVVDVQTDAQTRKLNTLRQHKQGLMQQLFPALEGQ